MRDIIVLGALCALLLLVSLTATITSRRQEALHDLFFAGGDCSSEGARRGAEALAESIVRGEACGR